METGISPRRRGDAEKTNFYRGFTRIGADQEQEYARLNLIRVYQR